MERLPLLKSFEEKHAYYSVLIQMRWSLTLLISRNINNHVIPFGCAALGEAAEIIP